MSIQQLIELCVLRLAHLSQLRTSAASLGDIEQLVRIDADTTQTQTTLNQLQTLT